jgi:hypothetical protein
MLLRRQCAAGPSPKGSAHTQAGRSQVPFSRVWLWLTSMKTSFPIVVRLAVLCGTVGLLVSCSRPLRLQVVLEKNEELTKGMPVFVDSTKAGTVVAIGEEGGERVADL